MFLILRRHSSYYKKYTTYMYYFYLYSECNALPSYIVSSIKMLSHKEQKFKTCVWYRRKKLKRDRPDNLSYTRYLTQN